MHVVDGATDLRVCVLCISVQVCITLTDKHNLFKLTINSEKQFKEGERERRKEKGGGGGQSISFLSVLNGQQF